MDGGAPQGIWPNAEVHDDGDRLRCVVAIPVRNEERRIEACLDALATQVAHGRAEVPRFEVILALNGCTDGTRERVRGWLRTHRLPVRIVDVELPAPLNHAGGARAASLGLAMEAVGSVERAVVMTTDADSRVPPDWIARAVWQLDQGCDAVAGDVDVVPGEFGRLPANLRERCRLEAAYTSLLDRVDALCDPLPHDPWPRHRRCSGANLAFRVEALAFLGNLPAPPCGEDRALVDACLARDLRVRHDPALRVETSARLRGRARGGMADTLRHRNACVEAPCDAALEPLSVLVARATARATARRAFRVGMSAGALAHAIGLEAALADDRPCRHFGEAWQRIEASCEALQHRPLSPLQLPAEIHAARTWLEEKSPASWKQGVAA